MRQLADDVAGRRVLHVLLAAAAALDELAVDIQAQVFVHEGLQSLVMGSGKAHVAERKLRQVDDMRVPAHRNR